VLLGVEVDVVVHPLELGLVLRIDRPRAEPAREQMSEPLVAPVEPLRVQEAEPVHAALQPFPRREHEQVDVVLDEAPGELLPAEPLRDLVELEDERVPVVVVEDDRQPAGAALAGVVEALLRQGERTGDAGHSSKLAAPRP